MKKLLFIPIALLAMSSCKQPTTGPVYAQNDSLSGVIDQRDSALADFIDSFNKIESNLDSVAAKQQIISITSNKFHGELLGNKKLHINAEIMAINDLMERNRKEIEDLKKKWKGSKRNNALLEKTIKTLTIQISQKDYELCELNLVLDGMKARVTKLVATVDSLDQDNYLKSMMLNYEANQLHIAYYRIGGAKELREDKVIDRKGGVLGIGRTSELSQDFDVSTFIKIDYTKTAVIPVNGEDVKVITNHPTDSYHFDKDDKDKDKSTNLVITDPEKFWAASKYLVVIKK